MTSDSYFFNMKIVNPSKMVEAKKNFGGKQKKEEPLTNNNSIDRYFTKKINSDCPVKTKGTDDKEPELSEKRIKFESSTAENKINSPSNKCDDNCQICSLESYMDSNWRTLLNSEFKKEYFTTLKQKLHGSTQFFPPLNQIFNFSKFTDFNNIKVVILGQDPYHNPGQAMGLAFSVPRGVPVPPSLRNIYSELSEDIENFKIPKHGDLTSWAKQGVLLLNDTLTVSKNMPGSHSNYGWKHLTSKILELINIKLENVVFILWGNHARSKASLINRNKHLVLEAAHPSPMSVSLFRGCRHFSKANEYLVSHQKLPIDWALL